MEYCLTGEWQKLNQEEFQQTEFQKKELKRDLEYLIKMKKMDDEIAKKGKDPDQGPAGMLEMTDVVPVMGLIMAKFHIFECECSSAIEVWDQNEKRNRGFVFFFFFFFVFFFFFFFFCFFVLLFFCFLFFFVLFFVCFCSFFFFLNFFFLYLKNETVLFLVSLFLIFFSSFPHFSSSFLFLLCSVSQRQKRISTAFLEFVNVPPGKTVDGMEEVCELF